MNRRWLPAFAVAALLPALHASDGGCKQDTSVLEGMPLTEVNVLQVTVDPGTAVSFKNGGASGTELLALTAPPAVGATYVDIPSDGIWFTQDPYVTITTVTNVTFFYG